MNLFEPTPVREVRPGDMSIWQYVQAIWQNDDDTYAVVFTTLGDTTQVATLQSDEVINVASIDCPKCGHHINPNDEGE